MTDKPKKVAEAIWHWREDPATGPKRPSVPAVLGQALIPVAIGALIFFVLKHRIPGIVIMCIGALLFVLGLAIPGFHAGVKKVVGTVAVGVGIGLSWLLLVPFFYLCFPMGRFFAALARRDPLNRSFPVKADSCWTVRDSQPDAASYEKQF